jgi:hypothetical protein
VKGDSFSVTKTSPIIFFISCQTTRKSEKTDCVGREIVGTHFSFKKPMSSNMDEVSCVGVRLYQANVLIHKVLKQH